MHLFDFDSEWMHYNICIFSEFHLNQKGLLYAGVSKHLINANDFDCTMYLMLWNYSSVNRYCDYFCLEKIQKVDYSMRYSMYLWQWNLIKL